MAASLFGTLPGKQLMARNIRQLRLNGLTLRHFSGNQTYAKAWVCLVNIQVLIRQAWQEMQGLVSFVTCRCLLISPWSCYQVCSLVHHLQDCFYWQVSLLNWIQRNGLDKAPTVWEHWTSLATQRSPHRGGFYTPNTTESSWVNGSTFFRGNFSYLPEIIKFL